jgi:hypothetical protein
MRAPRPILVAAAAIALAGALFATANDASARGRHGGHAAGQQLGHHHHHRFQLQQLRHHRHHHQRHFFTRFTPCTVWTRQGWTNVCSDKPPLVGSAPRQAIPR